MTACLAHLADDPTALCCTRADEHEPHHGCVYQSTSGVTGCPKGEA